MAMFLLPLKKMFLKNKFQSADDDETSSYFHTLSHYPGTRQSMDYVGNRARCCWNTEPTCLSSLQFSFDIK